MKYFKFLAFVGFGSLLLASCASDEPLGPNDRPNDGKVQFTINLDGAQTRAYGETPSCNELYYTVYDMDNKVVLADQQKAAFGEGVTSTTVELQLVANQQYKVIFYAHNSNSTFSSYANGKVTVNYANKNINSNIDDAFINKKEYTPAGATTALPNQVFTADGNAKTVYLTRPFAQVNIGTDDLNSAAVKNIINNVTTEFTVSTGLYTEYSILNEGSMGEPYTDPYTASTGAPSVNPNFPVEPEIYSNLLSVYLLVPQTQDVVNAQYVINLTDKPVINTLNLNGMPVQGNYRTNIYGSLLTTQNKFNVTIDPIFGTPDYNFSKSWDGTARKPAVIDETNKSMTINDGNELAWLAQQLSNANNEYAEYTVNLNADIDLSGNAWTPIGTQTAYTGKFNGNGHTIKNLTVSGSSNLGLFAKAADGAVIDNVILDNVNVNGTSMYAGALVGNLANSTVSNVKVKDGTIKGRNYAGGIVGYASGNSKIDNCDNAASVEATYRYGGGIVGYITSNQNGIVTVSGCNNTGNIANTAPSKGSYTGGIVGQSNGVIENCTNSGQVTGSGESLGGVVGEQRTYGSITGCKNTGNVIKDDNGYGTGGIVGWVRYYYPSFANPRGLVSVNDNINEGNVTGGTGCGGIVGVFYNYGFCENNKNYAQKITTTGTFVAGIIGNAQFPTTSSNLLPDVPADTKLVIKGNVTTTTDITGSCSNPLVYDNSLGKNTEISGNTIPD